MYRWSEIIEGVIEDSKLSAEKRLKGFDKKFKEIKHVQTALKLASSSLAKKLRAMNVEIIVPKYEALLNDFNKEVVKGKTIRYTVDKLKDTLNNFFTKV